VPRATSSNRDSKSPAIPLLLFAFLTTVLCKTSFAATITNDDPEFTLRVPDGYVQLHDTDKIHFGGINLYGFASTNATYGAPDTIVFVQHFGNTIPHEKMDLSSPTIKSLMASVGIGDAHLVKGHWSSFDIDMIDGQATHDGMLWAICAAPVPLQGEAAQIVVLVRPDEGETEAENTARDFLDGLSGPSSWSTSSDSPSDPQAAAFINGLLKLVIVVGSLIGASLALVAFFKKSQENSPQRLATFPSEPPPLPVPPAGEKTDDQSVLTH